MSSISNLSLAAKPEIRMEESFNRVTLDDTKGAIVDKTIITTTVSHVPAPLSSDPSVSMMHPHNPSDSSVTATAYMSAAPTPLGNATYIGEADTVRRLMLLKDAEAHLPAIKDAVEHSDRALRTYIQSQAHLHEVLAKLQFFQTPEELADFYDAQRVAFEQMKSYVTMTRTLLVQPVDSLINVELPKVLDMKKRHAAAEKKLDEEKKSFEKVSSKDSKKLAEAQQDLQQSTQEYHGRTVDFLTAADNMEQRKLLIFGSNITRLMIHWAEGLKNTQSIIEQKLAKRAANVGTEDKNLLVKEHMQHVEAMREGENSMDLSSAKNVVMAEHSVAVSPRNL